MTPLGEIVRAARAERGMSLLEFGRAVGLAECSIASVEYGGRYSQWTLERLAAFLGQPASQLDPDATAVERKLGPSQQAALGEAQAARAGLIEQLILLHAEFNVAHTQALAAIRAGNVEGLDAARARHAEILSQQDAVIDSYLKAGLAVGTRAVLTAAGPAHLVTE